MRAVAATAAVAVCALTLQGCGDTATTFTTTTITSTTTTTTSSSTMWVGPGGCVENQMQTDRKNVKDSMWCFCFYSGGCLDHFECQDREPMWNCQKRLCGMQTAADKGDTNTTVSFRDPHHEAAQLTITRLFFTDITDMMKHCPDGAHAQLIALLDAGRKAYAQAGIEAAGKTPDWQCVHLPRWVSVHWIHLWSFSGMIGHPGKSPEMELLPNQPPYACCAEGSLPLDVAAEKIIKLAADNPGESLLLSEASTSSDDEDMLQV